jgi:hypothetical protein
MRIQIKHKCGWSNAFNISKGLHFEIKGLELKLKNVVKVT